jgi:hypothetical protein
MLKFQARNKLLWVLEIGTKDLFGICNLELVISNR